MKKLCLSALLLLSCGIGYALPVGNPAEASLLTWGLFSPAYKVNKENPCCYWFDYWSLKMGYYGDFVFNHHLSVQGRISPGKAIQKTEMFTNAGYLALNLYNKIDIFGTLGASKMTITTSEASWFLGGTAQGKLDWDSHFSWSAGMRATIFEKNRFFLGVEGQYFQTSPDLNSYLSYASGEFNYFRDHNKMTYREWQAGLGLAYALTSYKPNFSVIPYVAVKCSWAQLHAHHFSFIRTGTTDLLEIRNLKISDHWGFAIGSSLTICEMVEFTVEGRWANESALYVNGTVRF